MGQHHLYAMLRAAPGLRALGGGTCHIPASDERQDVGKRGVAQRGASSAGGRHGRLGVSEGTHRPPRSGSQGFVREGPLPEVPKRAPRILTHETNAPLWIPPAEPTAPWLARGLRLDLDMAHTFARCRK